MIIKNYRFIGLAILLSLAGFGLKASEDSSVVYWNSPEATILQSRLPESADFWRLAPHMVTQKTQTYCGIASAVIILNVLGSRHGDPIYYPYTYVTQDSFFIPPVLPYLYPKQVLVRGADMAELQHAIQAHGLTVDAISGDSLTVDELRTLVSRTMVDSENYLLINYQRAALQQKKGGHWSILAAYDDDSDRVLILDVARFSYPPVWVTLPSLLNAVNSVTSDGNTRGLLMISGQPGPQRQPDSEDL